MQNIYEGAIYCSRVKSNIGEASAKITWSPLTHNTINVSEASLEIPSHTTTGSGATRNTFSKMICVAPPVTRYW